MTVSLAAIAPAQAQQKQTLLNVSYDPTRELYRAIDDAFAKQYKDKAGVELTIRQSHGGSGRQARSVIDGLEADVVTLALAYDIDAIADRGLLPENWQARLPQNSSPYTSTIVFLVRKGNPKQIKDWDDLVRTACRSSPQPQDFRRRALELPGGLGLRAREERRQRGQGQGLCRRAAQARAGAGYRRARRHHHLRRARRGRRAAGLGERGFPGARGAGSGQVRHRGALAVHPGRAAGGRGRQDRRQEGHRAAAQAYLEFLYTPAAQEIIAKNYYRPIDKDVAAKYESKFPKVKLVKIDDKIFGGWRKAQKDHFSDGGTFDQIYQPQKK